MTVAQHGATKGVALNQSTPKQVGPRAAPEPGRMSDAAQRRVQAELADGRDETNPAYLFSTTATSLLLAIVDGLIDPVRLAHETLASRGLDENGLWVGFEEAARIHGVKS